MGPSKLNSEQRYLDLGIIELTDGSLIYKGVQWVEASKAKPQKKGVGDWLSGIKYTHWETKVTGFATIALIFLQTHPQWMSPLVKDIVEYGSMITGGTFIWNASAKRLGSSIPEDELPPALMSPGTLTKVEAQTQPAALPPLIPFKG